MSAEEDDRVGYRKPPKAQRFGAARSGNRRGRPRGSKNIKTLVHQIAHERQVVQENGRTVVRATVELVFMTLQRKAMSGNVRAVKLLDQYRAAFDQTVEEGTGVVFVLPDRDTSDVHERWIKAEQARREYEQAPQRSLGRDGAS